MRGRIDQGIIEALSRLARIAGKLGATPNSLTIIGMILAVGGGVLLWSGDWIVSAIVVILSGLMDMLDGALARESRVQSRFGAVLDSACDRISDGAIYCGVMFYYLNAEWSPGWAFIAFLASVGAYMTSYVRARAECLVQKCDIGIAERPERIIIIVAGALFRLMKPALVILCVVSAVTVIQRILYARRRLRP